MRRTTCKTCGAPIFFARAATGRKKLVPLDLHPNPKGNVTIHGRNEAGEEIAWVTAGPPPSVYPPESVHMPHFATCKKT